MELEIDYQKSRKRRRRKRFIIKTVIWIVQIAAVIFLAYFITNIVMEKTSVSGDSMEKTLSDGDTLIVNKFAYLFGKPKRNDVIVFNQSGREHDYYDTKRIIGLPGETVQIIDGEVYIDGNLLEEAIQCDSIQIPGLAKEPVLLEENEYFVLGDNRNNSEDSRFANIGMVVKEEIVGKAWLRLNNFGFVDTFNRRRDSQAEETQK